MHKTSGAWVKTEWKYNMRLVSLTASTKGNQFNDQSMIDFTRLSQTFRLIPNDLSEKSL